MNIGRRRDALQRILYMFEREFDKERKAREGTVVYYSTPKLQKYRTLSGFEYLNDVYERAPNVVPNNEDERTNVGAKIRHVSSFWIYANKRKIIRKYV